MLLQMLIAHAEHGRKIIWAYSLDDLVKEASKYQRKGWFVERLV